MKKTVKMMLSKARKTRTYGPNMRLRMAHFYRGERLRLGAKAARKRLLKEIKTIGVG